MLESCATYCVIDSARDLDEHVTGLQGCRVRNLACGEVGVAVSSLAGPIGNLVAGSLVHEAVIERLMQTHTVLPMRFPTVLAGEEAVLALVTQHYESFRENLERLRGRVEFGVRVLWPRDMAGTGLIESSQGPGTAGRTSDATVPVGRRYMLDRCRRHREHWVLSEQAARFGAGLDAALSKLAVAKRVHGFTGNAFAFNGVYLVDRDNEVNFRRVFRQAKNAEPSFQYLFSGPWPAYNFITGPTAAPEARTVERDLVEYLGLAVSGGTHDRGTEG